MAQLPSNSSSTTRRSLRLLTAERKSISNEATSREVESDETQTQTSSSHQRQAKSKALEALTSTQYKRRIESDLDLSDELEDQLNRTHTNKSKRRSLTDRILPKKSSKRQRHSSSDDEESFQSKRSSLPNLNRSSHPEQQSESSETGNHCVRRGSAGRDLQTVASDPSTGSQQRRARRYSHKSYRDFLTTSSTAGSRVSTSNPSAASETRPCETNPGVASSADPVHLFLSPTFYQSTSASSPPPSSSSAQSYSGLVPSTSSTYHSSFVASANRNTKLSLPMSTESDTDPESSANAHDFINDPSFLRAAAAATGSSSASAALLQTLSGRVHHLMSRVGGNSSLNGRLQQYIQGMQSPDPDVKLSTLNELCSLLVMSNEDTLPGFQCRSLYGPLRDCLADENEANSEIVLTACRALTYLMEALPRTAMQVVEATPIFLSKLRTITSIDIAEQALIALEMISKRHGKQILLSDGIGACLAYIEFFSITSQNKALAIVANCCSHITNGQEFKYIREHLDTLALRLQSDDKKTIEHVCTIFSRLVENFSRDPTILCEILSNDLLKTLQNMIVVQPSLLNSITFLSIIHMLYVCSASCPKLAVTLLKMNIAETLVCLLIGSVENKNQSNKRSITYKPATLVNNETPVFSSIQNTNPIELLSRTPQELYEIVSFIGEIMPRLPNDEPLFQIDQLLRSNQTYGNHGPILWHWQDDQGQLRPYSLQDSQIIETAYQQHEEEVHLTISGRQYLLDLQQLQQVNEETSQARFIKRIVHAPTTDAPEPNSPPPTLAADNESSSTANSTSPIDLRLETLKDSPDLYNNFILSLFTILYEVYNSSAGPAVKHRCLQSLLRMIYYSSSDLLEHILRQQSISSHIASMLASSDYKIVISALQISEILMRKLPKIFSVYFYREGVVHQIEILIGFGISSSSQLSLTSRSQPAASSHSQADLMHMADTLSTPILGESFADQPAPSHRGATPQLHPKTQPSPYRTNTSRRHQTDSTSNDASSIAARVETRSQRGRAAPPTTTTGQSRMKPSARSMFDEMMSTSSDNPVHLPSSRGSRFPRPPAGVNVRQTTFDPSAYPPFSSGVRPRGSTPMYVPSPFSSQPVPHPFASSAPAAASLFMASPMPTSMLSQSALTTLSSQDKAKLREWIQTQARQFRATYFAENSPTSNIALEIIHRLASAVDLLHVSKSPDENLQALRDIGQILAKGDVSPFEMVHSGLITKLLQYLTDDLSIPNDRFERLKLFLHIFMNIPLENKSSDGKDLKEFLIELHQHRLHQEKSSNSILSHLIRKLHGCINQLEQFPIRVNDTAGRPVQNSALRLISTHHLKCNLVRHPQCKTLKQWNSGPVKIDPFALVSALEKYLLLRGVAMDDPSGTIDDEDSEVSNESDAEDIINVLAHTPTMRLEFLINDHAIPNNMTLFQAVRMYSNSSTQRSADGESETDNDEAMMPSTAIWTRVHTIHYRQANQSSSTVPAVSAAIGAANTTTSTSTRFRSTGGHASQAKSTKKPSKTLKRPTATAAPIVDELWITGQCPPVKSLLKSSLNESISSILTINDLSLNAISLLHILNGLNLHWYDLYLHTNLLFSHSNHSLTLVAKNDYISSKLTSKVNRQLQDPVVVMMGQIPSWITEMGYQCSFLFPFESRQLIFYTHAFDRERAMQRLLDSSNVVSQQQQQQQNDSQDRQNLGPRIERKKIQLSRANILPEMEKILENWNSKQFLEVQYEDEVGFGLGPTLEAYSLLSKELQKTGLELWRTDRMLELAKDKDNPIPEYVDNRHGLFPAPLGRNAKSNSITKVRQKFKFLGKLMGKALMDSRMIDMPFSLVFYKWMLADEESLTLEDLSHVDRNLYEQLKKLQNIVHLRDKFLLENQNASHYRGSTQKKRTKSRDDCSMDSSTMFDDNDQQFWLDGCRIDDLSLVFTLPGYPTIELKKGGKDCSVTLQNLDQYVQLVVHWTLVEGVRRQFESFRDGFNSIFSLEHLKCFYSDELHQVFCGSGSTELWDLKVLLESTRCDHGYNFSSRAVKWLFELMVNFDIDEQRAFLQFVTGSPRLPVGGFRMLHPPLTIVRKAAENNSDNTNPDSFLPSVMTCVNYLKLPDYSSKEIMKLKLTTAIHDGQHAFLLS